MAGGSVGTIYAELDIDASRYTKSQQKLLQDATTTTLSIEKNFKSLGIKTSAEFDLMRAKIGNAYEAILRDSKATANDILRAEQAKNDQLKRIHEQQFGHQATIIESLKKNWIAAAAVIGTAMVAASKAWDMAKVGADYEEQRGILDNLGRKYGQTSESIVASMRKASDELIADSDLMQIALGGIAKGLKPEQLTNLADAARILGDTVGKDATTALKDLSEALETGKTKALKGYLGTTIDLEAAFGDLYEKLTETEKANALYSITMIEATKLQSQQAGAVDDAGDKIERLEAKYKNLTTTMSIWAKTAVVWLFDMEGWKRGALAMSGIDIPEAPADNRFANPSEAPFDAASKQDGVIAAYEKQIDALKNLVKSRKDDEGATKAAQKAQDDYAKAVDDRAERELKALLKSSEESAKERIKQDEAVYLEEMELFDATEKENAKYLDDMKKDAEKVAKEEEALSLKRLKVERDIYSDIRGYEKDYSDDAIDLMWDQVQEYEKAGVSQVAIAAWIAEETYKFDQKKLKSSESFFDGMGAFFKESAHDMTTWANAGYQTMKTMSSSMASTFSNVFEDAYKRDMKSIGDYSTAIWDATRKKFFDVAGQMAAEKIMLFFETSWTSGGSNVLGIIDKILGFGSSLLGSDSTSNASYLGEALGDQYAAGGPVGGSAKYAGDHPGNDTVPAWLSPGEMVIRRTAVNARTLGILDYINKTGSVPGMAKGGIAGMVTNEPGKGYWGFGDIFGSVMGTVFNPIASFADWGKKQVGSAYNWVSDNVLTSENLATLSRIAAVAIATKVGGPYGAVAAAGTAGAQQAAISSTKGASFSESIKSGLISALATYAAVKVLSAYAPKAAAGTAGGGNTIAGSLEYGSPEFLEAAKSIGLSSEQAMSLWNTSLGGSSAWGSAIQGKTLEILAKEGGLQAIGFGKGLAARGLGITPAEGSTGSLSVAYKGAQDNGMFAKLASGLSGFAPKSFGFSARNGLDYVPYDNFPIIAHEGERVQTKKEAEATRGGGKVEFHFHGTIIDRKAIAEFAEMILPDINKLQRWGHA